MMALWTTLATPMLRSGPIHLHFKQMSPNGWTKWKYSSVLGGRINWSGLKTVLRSYWPHHSSSIFFYSSSLLKDYSIPSSPLLLLCLYLFLMLNNRIYEFIKRIEFVWHLSQICKKRILKRKNTLSTLSYCHFPLLLQKFTSLSLEMNSIFSKWLKYNFEIKLRIIILIQKYNNLKLTKYKQIEE